MTLHRARDVAQHDERARLADLPVEEKDIRQLTFEGGEGYDFTPDGSALIYSIRNRVWRHPLMGGAPEEIPIRLELQRPTPRPVLLRRVRLLDYARGGFRDESSVYVDQGRIRWIGSERDQNISPDAVILDAGGRFAIPGLFDMETHLGASGIEQETFLAYGITSLLDVGGGLAWLNTLADRRDASAEPRPRSFFSGPTFYGGGNVNGPLMLRDEDEARTYVRRSKASGVHFIKVFPPMSWAVQRAVTEEARRQGLPVMWHNINLEGITKGVMLGNAFLERLHVSGRLYDDVLRMLAAAGTRWLPTLNMPVGNELLLRTQPERLTDPKLLAFRTESSIRAGLTHNGLDVVTTNEWRGFWSDWLEGVQQAHRLGVTLLAGTDSDCCGRVFFGLSLHWELEHFVDAGLSPLEVLRLATLGAAQAVGAETDLGTLEPGKLADIVLLDKNPIDDIKNTKTIWRVLRDGWIYDPDKLRSLANRSHQVPFRVPLK
jgi:imidazolonepropionase-like amidohydrolase